MKIEQINEMFPTKNVQRTAQRILEVLLKSYNVDVIQISEQMSPGKSDSARISECRGLSQVLTDLHVLGIIDCSQDYYSPNEATREALDLLYSLHKAKKNPSLNNDKPKYEALLCASCGAIISAKGSAKYTVCPRCNHKNNLDNAGGVLIRTNDIVDFQSKIREEKVKRYANYRKL
jgi:hypothetical protein